jgi:hypothetical protein
MKHVTCRNGQVSIVDGRDFDLIGPLGQEQGVAGVGGLGNILKGKVFVAVSSKTTRVKT